MTSPLLSFAGQQGRTVRSLHQTAERNILRRHHLQNKTSRRWQSTKPEPPAQPQAKQHLAFTAWLEPIKIPFRSYERMQQRSPLLTQWETTLVIYFLGDLCAQAVQTEGFGGGRYEPIRGLRAMIIGGIMSIPSFKWFIWLGRNFNYPSHIKSLAVKILISQTLFTPIFNTYFFGMQTLLSGGSFQDAVTRVKDTVPVSWMNSWKLWPAVTAFNFTFIREQNRSVVAGLFAIGWQTYLSWLNRRAEREEKQDKRDLPARKEKGSDGKIKA